MLLREVAHSRTGDKGNLNTLSVIAYDQAHWELLRDQVTSELVAEALAPRVVEVVARYELPHVRTILFLVRRAAADTVTSSTWLDAHGKSLSSVLLGAEIKSPSGG